MSDGEFDWGGRLRKGLGGAQSFPQNGWKPFEERKGRRGLDCDTDGWSCLLYTSLANLNLLLIVHVQAAAASGLVVRQPAEQLLQQAERLQWRV